jgi:hypothetical protein
MTTISREDLDVLFREARSYNVWLPKKVPEETLHRLYDLLKWPLPVPIAARPDSFSSAPQSRRNDFVRLSRRGMSRRP